MGSLCPFVRSSMSSADRRDIGNSTCATSLLLVSHLLKRWRQERSDVCCVPIPWNRMQRLKGFKLTSLSLFPSVARQGGREREMGHRCHVPLESHACWWPIPLSPLSPFSSSKKKRETRNKKEKSRHGVQSLHNRVLVSGSRL